MRTTSMRTLAILALAWCAPAAWAGQNTETWVLVAAADDSEMLVHVPSFRRSGETASGWVLTNFQKSQGKPPATFRSGKAKFIVDCRRRQLASAPSTLYSKVNGEGDVVRSGGSTVGAFGDAIPDTLGEALVEDFCKRWDTTASAPDPEMAKLDAVFPGWADFVTSPGFQAWLKTQPESRQRMCNRTNDAGVFLACINGYRVHSGLPVLTLQ